MADFNFLYLAQINLFEASGILRQKAKNFGQNEKILCYCTSGIRKDQRKFPLKARAKDLR